MDKSYIIRIYKQENETVTGVLEGIDQNKRSGFSDAKQLWSLITNTRQKQHTDNVIKPEVFNSTGEAKTSVAIINSK